MPAGKTSTSSDLSAALESLKELGKKHVAKGPKTGEVIQDLDIKYLTSGGIKSGDENLKAYAKAKVALLAAGEALQPDGSAAEPQAEPPTEPAKPKELSASIQKPQHEPVESVVVFKPIQKKPPREERSTELFAALKAWLWKQRVRIFFVFVFFFVGSVWAEGLRMTGEAFGQFFKSILEQLTVGISSFFEGFFGVYTSSARAAKIRQLHEIKHALEAESNEPGKTINIVLPAESEQGALQKVSNFMDRVLTAGVGAAITLMISVRRAA